MAWKARHWCGSFTLMPVCGVLCSAALTAFLYAHLANLKREGLLKPRRKAGCEMRFQHKRLTRAAHGHHY
eukprot:6205996-Pleurochrysis_carterae.AAC.2